MKIHAIRVGHQLNIFNIDATFVGSFLNSSRKEYAIPEYVVPKSIAPTMTVLGNNFDMAGSRELLLPFSISEYVEAILISEIH